MRRSDPALLRAEEVYAILRECAGNCTVIVSACASGMWADIATQLPWSLDDARITLLTRSTGSGEIYSHHRSQSGHYRGFYLNGIAGRLYEEVGLHFPRPNTVNGDIIQRFQPQNIDAPPQAVSDRNRIKTTSLGAFHTEVVENLGALRYPNSVPSAGPLQQHGHYPASIFFGIPGAEAVPIRFTSVIPANPSSEFDARSVTGSRKFCPRSLRFLSWYSLLWSQGYYCWIHSS